MTKPRVSAFANLTFQPRFDYGDQAQVAQVCGADDLSALGAGFARMTDARFPWTIKYDEVLLVVEGELTVHTTEGALTAGPKDTIFLPKGAALEYEAKDALIFYAIHPANWAEA